ncbi:hypothetical protein LXA43DRAFT_892865 [Ganoderma leucocontextum]|nr:hypothetical protein LXA43DRAFT_892865 [Ganoderma leucocontextum]
MFAISLAVARTTPFIDLHINTDSKYVVDGLTKFLPEWEAAGWIGIQNAPIIRDAVARLRARSAATTFRWIKGHAGIEGNEGADELAKKAVESGTEVDLPRPRLEYLRRGACLRQLTQSRAYAGIRINKTAEPRKTTTRNVETAIASVKGHLGFEPTESLLWRAIRNRDIDRRMRDFWWKLIHGAQRVGKFWDNISGYEERATCGACGQTESMEHIVLGCEAPGQSIVWRLCLQTIRQKCGVDLQPDMGLILAAPCTSLRVLKGKRCPGMDRLLRIILTESIYLIWALRCERVIDRDNDPDRWHTEEEIRCRWQKKMNRCLKIDQCLAHPKWGRRALPRSLVLATWGGILSEESALPPDWIGVTGVLVGMPGPGARSGVG